MVKNIAPQMTGPDTMAFFNECLELSETQIEELEDDDASDLPLDKARSSSTESGIDGYAITREAFVQAAMASKRVEGFTQQLRMKATGNAMDVPKIVSRVWADMKANSPTLSGRKTMKTKE
jgi:hypothetical protein